MLQKIIGKAMTNKMMKKVQAGPASLLPASPAKGSGRKLTRGAAPARLKKFIVRKQNPAFTPKTGGLVRPRRMR